MKIPLPVLNRNEIYEINPTKIIALGLNYRDHIRESRKVKVRGFDSDIPSEPILFAKTPNVLIASGDPIVIPRFLKEYGFDTIRVDYEAELACVINTGCKNVSEEAAFDYILGYTCMNDVSQRNLQSSDRSGWFRGKSLDTFGPVGPVLVPQEDIGNPQNLSIVCRLNGKIVQQSNSRNMIFSIPRILSFISRNFTLESGDLILTGTPSGVGPLKNGDMVEVEIERIGILKNPVIEEE
jgi:2-keto-4-pentenoate hydratase/2-oxohepta-3-ene-1,7-dioic acid hydratase in catechol pathway